MTVRDIGFEPPLEPPEPRVFCECDGCRGFIYHGENGAYIGQKYYCEGCLDAGEKYADAEMFCEACGREIGIDEKFYLLDGLPYCEECVDAGYAEADCDELF